MCNYPNCSQGTTYLVYAPCRRLFGRRSCLNHLQQTITALQELYGYSEKLIIEHVN